MTLEIGKSASLEILRASPIGLILTSGEDEVLLPKRYVPKGTSPGEFIEVFVYTDSEDRPIATTERPLAEADEFACLRVVSVNRVGAFLDWGLAKDLLLPFRSQLHPLKPGQRLVVRVLCDSVSGRPVATAMIERFLEQPGDELVNGQAVRLLIYEHTDLGSKAIVDGRFGGLLYCKPGDDRLAVGATPTGYVQRVRDDGKIDLSLSPTGKAGREDARHILLDALVRAGGRLQLNDDSDPETIRRTVGMSKKAFKRALGALYRERRVLMADSSIELTGAGADPATHTSDE